MRCPITGNTVYGIRNDQVKPNKDHIVLVFRQSTCNVFLRVVTSYVPEYCTVQTYDTWIDPGEVFMTVNNRPVCIDCVNHCAANDGAIANEMLSMYKRYHRKERLESIKERIR